MTARKRYAVTIGIVVVGWSIAIPIFLLNGPAAVDPLDDYKHSKRYLDGIERVGGKAAVFGAELTDGIKSLFTGDTLGLTLGCITLAIAGVYFYRTRPTH